MKITIACTLFIISLSGLSQKKDIEVFHEAQPDGKLNIYAKNNTQVTQSVELQATLKGMEASEQLPITKVIAPQSTMLFFTLTPVKKSYSYNTQFSYIKGDITANHDDKTIYYLPYKIGSQYRIGQGYHESPTHMNQFALDFNMEEGTEICAIRDGIVFEVEESHNKGCPNKDCSQYNNYVLVQHTDGSFADYSHIKKNGAKVKAGDKVKVGDVLALSGSTGYASGPHLHLEVYIMRLNGQKSIEAQYYLDPKTIGIPKSGESYIRRPN